MTATDRAADQNEAAQLAVANVELRAELERYRGRLNQCIEAGGRFVEAARRGNTVAQAVMAQRAAMVAWQKADNPATRTRLNVARVALDDAVQAWLDGQK